MGSENTEPLGRLPGQIDIFDKIRVLRIKQHVLSDSRFHEFRKEVSGKEFYEIDTIHCELESGSLLVGLVYDGYVQGIRMYFQNDRWEPGFYVPTLPESEDAYPLVWHPEFRICYMMEFHPEKLTWRDKPPMI